MKRSFVVAFALCALSCGSKTPSPAAAHIRDAEDADLNDCTFLQKVEGTASEGDKDAVVHAKNAAREQAAKLGATHIKWIVPCCSSVEGQAYRCDLPSE